MALEAYYLKRKDSDYNKGIKINYPKKSLKSLDKNHVEYNFEHTIMGFGKFKGSKYKDIPSHYLEWFSINCSDKVIICGFQEELKEEKK